ncbi:hypothetical protein RA28_06985 [Ruegeria sp. ANG-S4]|uniref:SagB family peptide dehydrogenase n=1 Tax=Ruegeria sp. ANG-S4 TaxID=1577904 RepID=UPI00057CC4C2|nr:SagB family peptide dehydrogenase [Ruegeria sp. ANG-S4]KIC47370.1 hypothetical protein RA28_06985 [Ruegeria sp. ANG-S4]
MPQAEPWSYGLVRDVALETSEDHVLIRTPARTLRFAGKENAELVRLLAKGDAAEDALGAAVNASDMCAALLFRLDQIGLLIRSLLHEGRRIAACVPHRAPEHGLPQSLSAPTLQLSSRVILQPVDLGYRVYVPGSWAEIEILGAGSSLLLFDLAQGMDAKAITAARYDLDPLALDTLLRMFQWCGLLDTSSAPHVPTHEALFHSRTRTGFSRSPIGKTGEPPSIKAAGSAPQIELPMLNIADLIARDPPYALVSQRRKSQRTQGSDPISREQLGELLFRCFYTGNGHHAYPSGGGLYPLTAHLVVHRSDGLASGLYSYDAGHHGLNMIADINPSLKALVMEAASAADTTSPSQILLVLSANLNEMRWVYGDLAYSLVLKEVGAVFQTVQLAGAAMNLAVCPLGTGNSLRFAQASGLSEFDDPSVGEMLIGSAK